MRDVICRQIFIKGAVQGVGFRPFVYRLAKELAVNGQVNNDGQGVCIEVEGSSASIDDFINRVVTDAPPVAVITDIQVFNIAQKNYSDFVVVQSDRSQDKSALVIPDLAICADCRRELFDHNNRRCSYPFINCTNCGPRFTIIEQIPYDRPFTTMREFVMCEKCQSEYVNPDDRRFHAQPNACHNCGPHVELWNKSGNVVAAKEEALDEACNKLSAGHVVAVKGLGGFHLMVLATDTEAVALLRKRKCRDEKPLAVMFPDLEQLKTITEVDSVAEKLLLSPQAPIVLVPKRSDVAPNVAPRNRYLGVMLPYTPLHLLLLTKLGKPVVATSGNLSDEPICIDENEALQRLANIADYFLVHNRKIVRPIDDSVVRVVGGKPLFLRRARGYAPLPITCKRELPSLLACGGHLKSVFAVSKGNNIYLSQHIGDLENRAAIAYYRQELDNVLKFYDIHPQKICCDAHPDYVSTHIAHALSKSQEIPLISIYHHVAHIYSGMAEYNLTGPVLGVAWDGTGYGDDGTIWGGEFIRITADNQWQRVATIKPFHLVGGDRAVREPRRAACSVLYEMFGESVSQDAKLQALVQKFNFNSDEYNLLIKILQNKIHAVKCTSVGRLFDAVAALLGICNRVAFEGQAAMELEYIADDACAGCDSAYPVDLDQVAPEFCLLNWEPMFYALIDDIHNNVAKGEIARKFHLGLVHGLVKIAKVYNISNVVLSGGVFQNKILTEQAHKQLTAAGFNCLIQRKVSPNDGGIALGQIWSQVLNTPQ